MAVSESDATPLELAAVNIKASEKLEKEECYDESLRFLVRGLEHLSEAFDQTYQTTKNVENPKEFLISVAKKYMTNAKNINKHLKSSIELINTDKLLHDYRNKLDEYRNLIENNTHNTPKVSNMSLSSFNLNLNYFSDLIGFDYVVEYIKSKIKFFKNKNYEQNEGILLFGPPGSGKNLFVNKLISFCRLSLNVKILEIDFSQEIQTNGSNFMNTIRKAKELQPTILSMHNLEVLEPTSKASESIISDFLCEFETLLKSGVIIIGVSNLPWRIHPSILFRFIKRFYIDLPNSQKIEEIFNEEFFKKLMALNNGLSKRIFPYFKSRFLKLIHYCPTKIVLSMTERLFNDFKSKYSELIDKESTSKKSLKKTSLSLETIENEYFYEILIFLEDRIRHYVSINSISSELLLKYERFNRDFSQ